MLSHPKETKAIDAACGTPSPSGTESRSMVYAAWWHHKLKPKFLVPPLGVDICVYVAGP